MSDMRIAPGSDRAEAAPVPASPTPAPGGHWRRPDVLIPTLLVAVFLVLLALVLARPTPLTHADSWIRDRVQSTSHAPDDNRAHWPLVRHIADLGGTFPALPVLAVVAGAAALLRRSWRPVLAAGAAYAVLGGVVLTLKATVDRPGPGQLTLVQDGLGYFPSGHTANTLMCYGTCALLLAGGRTGAPVSRPVRAALAAGMTALALAVGFSLVWLDYHWVSDVLGSYVLCGAALFGVAAILGFHAPGRRRGAAVG